MRLFHGILFSMMLLAGLPAMPSAQAQQSGPLLPTQRIALTGVERRIDHMAYDAAHSRLLVAALGNNTVEVIDIKGGRRLHTVSGLHEPQGVCYAPASNRVFIANGQSGDCRVLNGASYQEIGNVPLGDDADNVRYDARANRVYVGYGSGALGIVDAATSKVAGRIALSGHPESFQLEGQGPRIYVNVPSAGHIAVLDREKHTVVANWAVTEARSNFPMALDEDNHRLIVGCRDPARALVYDTQTGRVAASFPIVGDTDDLFYDRARKRLYVSGGEGFLEVFEQRDADHYTRIQRIATAPGARTSLFVPEAGALYLAVPHRGNQPAEIRVFAVHPEIQSKRQGNAH